ncbi:MAG: hypothetical protein M1816_005673 [Peltula sp. TS41687]|nr:MAG: hypothetical protein M1816_005673 [Peltula sp. TS41687]
MGWDPSNIFLPGQLEKTQSRKVKQLLESYRQRCISTCLLYPTFRSSSVIMTMSAVRTVSNTTPNAGTIAKADSRRLCDSQVKTPPRPPPPKESNGPAFLRFWWTDKTRETFLTQVPSEDLASLRRACHDFSVRAAPCLFADLTITFRPSTFTKPARMVALERIGHYIRTLTFVMPHTAETFLPPLIDPITGEQKAFVYQPQLSNGTSAKHPHPGPKYGSWEMTDLLVKQYGPLFHAATNVPAFIRAFTAMPGIVHLKISCPGQEPSQRYRRSAVDYALISLRMAVERAPLKSLSALSLMPIHPGGLLYLRSVTGFGSRPDGLRRWAQITKLAIHMDSWAFSNDPDTPTDHLKHLHNYLLTLSPNIERLFFRWRGARGPCPFTLDTEPILTPPASASPDGSAAPRTHHRLPRLRLPRLRCAELSNSHPDAAQLNRFIHRHRRTLQECDFDAVELRTGSWDEALAVLTRISGSEKWKEDMLSPTGTEVSGEEPSDAAAARGHGRDSYFGSPEHMKGFLRDSVRRDGWAR